MFCVHTQDIVSYTYYLIWANNYFDVTVTMQHQAKHNMVVVLIYNNNYIIIAVNWNPIPY